MQAWQIGFLVGALATAFLSLLFVWLLQSTLSSWWAIAVGNLGSLLLASALYGPGFGIGLSRFLAPQAVCLVAMLLIEGIRLVRAAKSDAAAERARQRVEPVFGGSGVPTIPSEAATGQPNAGSSAERPTATTSGTRLHEAAGTRDIKPDDIRSRNIIMNHWRGLYPLAVSYWVFGVIVSVVAIIVTTLIQVVFASDDGYQPVLIFVTVLCVWIFVSLITVWQSVGLWRSAGRRIAQRRIEGKAAPWAWVAKVLVILGALRWVATFTVSTAPQLNETYRMAFLGDPDLPEYAMRIMRNGTEVEISGGFKYGLTDDFKKLLKASPRIAVVHLDSPGGRVGEAVKLNKVIRAARLKTYVSSQCASACTVAFAGGTERWLRGTGILGFHGGAFPGMSRSDLADLDSLQRIVMVRSGYDPAFVSRALAVPNANIWEPTIAELKAAHVITAVSNGTQFAASGYGGAISKQAFVELAVNRVPMLRQLNERFPAYFDSVLDRFYQGYLDGWTDERMSDFRHYVSYFVVRRFLAGADDQSVTELGALMIDQLRALKARDPALCAEYGSVGGADPDLLVSLPMSILARYQALAAKIIETSTERLPDGDDRSAELIHNVIIALRPTLSESQLAILGGARSPNAQQAADYCEATIAFYQQVLRSSPADAAVMLRARMKSSQGEVRSQSR